MDIVASSGRGRIAAAKLRRSATEVGIGPDEPLAPLVEALSETAESFDSLDARLSLMLDRAEAVAGGQIARTAAAELPQTVRALTFKQHRRMFLWGTVALVGALAIGGCAGALWQHETARSKITAAEAQAVQMHDAFKTTLRP